MRYAGCKMENISLKKIQSMQIKTKALPSIGSESSNKVSGVFVDAYRGAMTRIFLV